MDFHHVRSVTTLMWGLLRRVFHRLVLTKVPPNICTKLGAPSTWPGPAEQPPAVIPLGMKNQVCLSSRRPTAAGRVYPTLVGPRLRVNSLLFRWLTSQPSHMPIDTSMIVSPNNSQSLRFGTHELFNSIGPTECSDCRVCQTRTPTLVSPGYNSLWTL